MKAPITAFTGKLSDLTPTLKAMQQPEFAQTLHHISKEALTEAIATIGRMYPGFTSASFGIDYQDGYDWLKVYAHYGPGVCYMASADHKPGAELMEAVASALTLLNEKILRDYDRASNTLKPRPATHTITLIEQVNLDEHLPLTA